MGKVYVIECDNPKCKKILRNTEDIFRLIVRTDDYIVPGSPGPDYDVKQIILYFCENCARDIKASLEEIVNDNNKNIKKG